MSGQNVINPTVFIPSTSAAGLDIKRKKKFNRRILLLNAAQ